MEDRNKFITENHKLIYQFAHDHKINLNEFYDILAIGLVKAADTFDEDKGFRFSTYAFSVMKNQYLMELRKIKKDGLMYSLSLENMAVDDIPFIELLRGDSDVKGKYSDDVERFLDNLKEDEKKILYYLIEELNQDQIAENMNLSQSYISRKITKIRKNYKQLANGGKIKWRK